LRIVGSIAAPEMQAQTPTALVVEDDAALRMLVRVNLELEGFAVEEASTLDEAEAALGRLRPDVVLLDVHLDGRETLGLLSRLRADGVPVALVTGSVDVDEYRDAADAVLSKPFAPQALVAIARRLARVEV
jgi:DNA-binding response OmpR family regulator